MSKYRNRKVTIDGIKFDSVKEANRYSELKLLAGCGDITDLQLQVPFRIDVNGQHICKYIADFTYVDGYTGEQIVEDVKGYKTDVYRLKKKLMKAALGIEIQEYPA